VGEVERIGDGGRGISKPNEEGQNQSFSTVGGGANGNNNISRTESNLN